ncbi:alpha/beta fold hydrolase [Streptomyces sp. AK02-01A]|uniref:alpha/beta fold hydrolase n=1 Tax=Streptomyces sp. AK02-01A TaxID=3028648 RepID=UPI0029A0C132|nr:alpha/beta fold hydrolase [Streptomyces sp. AK02-01A]MDX3850322.1 alpha/beta fold hydrolase [Streptomyces sp. AK02-01A]
MSETFVLAHGAWHGGWAWQPVAARLRAAGHRVLAPTSPGLGINDDPRDITLDDCVDALVGFVERLDLSDVTLVAHSWGGCVVGDAERRLAGRLKRVVFFSAFVPRAGESVLDAVGPDHRALFEELRRASRDDTILPPFEVFASGFIQDADEATARAVYELMRPQPYRTVADGASADAASASADVPSAYVLAADDRSLAPGEYGWEPRFPERLGVPVIRTPGSHEALFTRPEELSRTLLGLVGSGRPS